MESSGARISEQIFPRTVVWAVQANFMASWLLPMDYFFWGYVKKQVFHAKVFTLN
jgi:hypothetical protein